MLHKLSIIIALRTSDQKAIEHSASDHLVAVRHELVETYALAFHVVMELILISRRYRIVSSLAINSILKVMIEQNERFESVMKLARLEEPSAEAALLGEMHRELLAKMQQEMRGGFQTLEDGMQKRLEELEQRVVTSVREILPGIIREEMRRLLVEQKDSGSLNDGG